MNDRQSVGGKRQGLTGCFVIYGSIAVWLIITPLIIFFAPFGWLTGFCWGAATIAIAIWGSVRSSALDEYWRQSRKNGLTDEELALREQGVRENPQIFDRVYRIFAVALMIFLAVMSLIFFGFVFSLANDDNFGSSMTGASMDFGMMLTAGLGWWKFGMRYRRS